MWDHQDTIKILDSDKSLDLFRGRASFLQTSKDLFHLRPSSLVVCYIPYDHWLVLGCLGVSYNNPLHGRYSRELGLKLKTIPHLHKSLEGLLDSVNW